MKMEIDTDTLDAILISKEGKAIWQQKVKSKWVYVNLINELIIASILIYYLRDLVNVNLSVLFTIPALILLYQAKTMKYSILPDEIRFEWGLFWMKRNESIPFSDITAINLVEYDNTNYSTLYFGTNRSYKIQKINFDDNQSRTHITFENIVDGKQVFDLLNTLWHRSKRLKSQTNNSITSEVGSTNSK